MPRAKKAPNTPSNVSDISSAPAKRVTSVNPDASNAGVKTNGDLEAAIRNRAYQIYEERGRTDGLAHEDWVRAEREVLAQQGKRTA
jgi:hypothetical protein